MVYDNRLFGKRSALNLALIISVIYFLIMLMAYFLAKSNDIGRSLVLSDLVQMNTVVTFVSNTVILYILLRFQFWVVKDIKRGKKSTLIITAGSVLLLLILSPLFSYIQFSQIQWQFTWRIPEVIFFVIYFVKDFILVVITLLLTALMYTWDMNQKHVVENQKLMIQSLQNRYEALKNQVDPHFLFNSLNTLNGLVGYDDDKAHEYISQLSSIFRYTMQNKQILQVREELDFAQSYIYLMKIRFNEGIQITDRIDDRYQDYYILPFALQILIENAVKHNVISNKYPLSIAIETTENDTICIKNSIRTKNVGEGSGIGLPNLDERYRLVFGKKIKITQDDNYFVVEIPLIKDIEKCNEHIHIT